MNGTRDPVRRGAPHLDAHRAAELRRPGRADRGDAPHPRRGEALDRARSASCTRSTTACCCPGPRRSSSRPTSAGSCTARAGGLAAGHPVRAARLRRDPRALASLYAAYGQLPLVAGIFFGLKPAVLALVLEAVLRDRRGARSAIRCRSRSPRAAFVAIFFLAVPFPWIVLGAGAIGLVGLARRARRLPAAAAARCRPGAAPVADALLDQRTPEHARPSRRARAARRARLPRALVGPDRRARRSRAARTTSSRGSRSSSARSPS